MAGCGSVPGRWALFVLAVLASVFASVDASADAPTVTGILAPVSRVEPNGTNADSYSTGNPHPGGVPTNVVNYSDCEHDLRFQFTLSLSGVYPDYDLVAWAGPTDCTAAAAREGATATCWPVTDGPIPQGGGKTEAGAQTTTVPVYMRDIAAQAGTSTAVTPVYASQRGSDAACQAQAGAGATSVSIYFFFTDRVTTVGNAIGVGAAYPIVVDTVAETIGDAFSVTEQLDSQLTVAITAPVSSDTTIFNVYCDPPPGQETAVGLVPYDAASNHEQCIDGAVDSASAQTALDAEAEAAAVDAEAGAAALDAEADGAAADAAPVATSDAAVADAQADATSGGEAGGADASSTLDEAGGNGCGTTVTGFGPGSCSAGSVLQPGGGTTTGDAGIEAGAEGGAEAGAEAGVVSRGKQTLEVPGKYLCGTAAVGSPTLTLAGLRDGYFYNIAVAAVDGAGNIGPLSVACTGPVQLADFWYNYTAAGGQAGGGYCSTAEGVGVPAGTTGLGVLMVAAFVAVVRKRRR